MKIVTAKQMQAIDKITIEEHGIDGLTLMENAGLGIAEAIVQYIEGELEDFKVAILCGKGNNGGDGFVVGRYLSEWGSEVIFYLLGEKSDLKGDAKTNLERAEELELAVEEVSSVDDLEIDDDTDLIIDAIFGTGFHGDIRNPIDEIVDFISELDIPIVSVDCPSGLNSSTGELSSSSVSAEFTATLALPKIGQVVYPGKQNVGHLEVIDIGIPDEVVESEDLRLNLIDAEYLTINLPFHPPDGHKGSRGKLFIIAGSEGMTGAACMTASSATRSGIGLCYLGLPKSINDICEIKLTETITRPLPEVGKKRCLALRGLGEFGQYLDDADACALGPGIGTHHETCELVKRLMKKINIPTVIDADGLNCFEADVNPLIEADFPCVITPHPGELSRLIEIPTAEIASDRMRYAREAAEKLGKIVLLKGAPTYIADPEGNIYLNPTGNIGMATGGSGDVLTGIIAALLTQGLDPLEAACCGAYLHGMAGDLARADLGSIGMTPADMIDFLPEAFLMFRD